jgi:hypothetical protein
MGRGMSMTAKSLTIIAPSDRDAIEIGTLYHKARSSIIQSVQYCIEAGHKLIAKKDSLAHGEWLPWLANNADALGFENRSTATRLMNAAKCCVDASFDETKAIQVSREIWANREDSQLIQQQISAEHYTPAQYIAAAHRVLGTIDLDPASCSEANKIIKATKFFDEKIDGLAQEWRGRIWLNPPYCGLSGPFVEKLCAEYIAENVTAAIVLVNAHCTDTKWFQLLWDFPICFTDHRINFYGDGERSGSTHGNAFAYLGLDRRKFADNFEEFGAVVRRYDDP